MGIGGGSFSVPTIAAFGETMHKAVSTGAAIGVFIAIGGTIGFVGPLAELFGGAPALLLGIEDPQSNAHAPNESLPEADFKALMRSITHLFTNLAELPGGKVK